jgi:hypothetical protein
VAPWALASRLPQAARLPAKGRVALGAAIALCLRNTGEMLYTTYILSASIRAVMRAARASIQGTTCPTSASSLRLASGSCSQPSEWYRPYQREEPSQVGFIRLHKCFTTVRLPPCPSLSCHAYQRQHGLNRFVSVITMLSMVCRPLPRAAASCVAAWAVDKPLVCVCSTPA